MQSELLCKLAFLRIQEHLVVLLSTPESYMLGCLTCMSTCAQCSLVSDASTLYAEM